MTNVVRIFLSLILLGMIYMVGDIIRSLFEELIWQVRRSTKRSKKTHIRVNGRY